MRTEDRSDLIAFRGLRYAPENEQGVVLLFGKIHSDLGFPEIDVIQPNFPDCWVYQRTNKGTKRIWIEFEFKSKSFKSHLEQLKDIRPRRGIVVCWEDNWPQLRKIADVIELKTAVGIGKKIWIQCTNPEYQNEIDNAPASRKRAWTWTVSPRARPKDIVLMYRSGTKTQARKYGTDETLLQSIANIYEITSLPKPDKRWKSLAYVRQIASLREPLRLVQLREDPFLKNASWMRADLRSRPDVTAQWWRISQLILNLNPELKKDKKFNATCPRS